MNHVDLQVNGYAGVDFNADELTHEGIVAACDRMRDDGIARCLATIITDSLDAMTTRIDRIAASIDADPGVAQTICGIHVEGPFLSPRDGYVGAHPKQHVRPANMDDAARLIDAGCGHVRLMTLAPEHDSDGRTTSWLSGQGIVVAAGHSNASVNDLDLAIDSGLNLFTHLGNGCPAQLPRHDNIIQRVLSRSSRLHISFIADGHHVPMMALANYLRCIPDEHIVIVSDAISAAGLGPGTYALAGQNVHVDEFGAAWAECRTHYAGCATSVQSMVTKLRDELGIDEARIDQWTRLNPARLLEK